MGHYILSVYRTPYELQYKALFLGFTGALWYRLMLFSMLGTVVASWQWFRVCGGALLIMTGICSIMMLPRDTLCMPEDFFVVRLLKLCLGGRLQGRYEFSG